LILGRGANIYSFQKKVAVDKLERFNEDWVTVNEGKPPLLYKFARQEYVVHGKVGNGDGILSTRPKRWNLKIIAPLVPDIVELSAFSLLTGDRYCGCFSIFRDMGEIKQRVWNLKKEELEQRKGAHTSIQKEKFQYFTNIVPWI